MSETPVRQFLKDYRQPNFLISETHLTFEIHDNSVLVTNEMKLIRKEAGPLILTGPGPSLRELYLQLPNSDLKRCLPAQDFQIEGDHLTLLNFAEDSFQLKVVTELKPDENTTLLGLYKSGTGLCTQCEPEGFRNITFFLDRPDVMARYSTTIIASKEKYPILLSNGNRLSQKDLGDGRHQVQWQDPFPKPSYLFALVAGDYGFIKDEFITKSGRTVSLEIYCEKGNEFQCAHAMQALKRSMKWDEDTYEREYDLDQYLILAVDDFNGGAMENKGLNIFNSRLVFADTTTATDEDFDHVESVIAHEYFHNWTGNRITLRDWFQLSLKEGLTVFREQHYMGDMASQALKRIDNVELLRNRQFPEDAGPNAHPVRPESCFAVDNFYTMTVYEKGAEVIRVLKQLLGASTFKKGMDHYFETYDGQSITIEDFLASFEKVSGKSLEQFRRWYSQAGTPQVKVKEDYNRENKTYTLSFEQSYKTSQDGENKKPLVIPIRMSLYSPSSKKQLPLTAEKEVVLELSESSLKWTLNQCEERPIPSILRGFTAPVHLDWDCGTEQLEFLATHDDDGFNQWECLQKLGLKELTANYQQIKSGGTPNVNKNYVTLYQRIIATSLEKPELSSRLLKLPSQDYFLQTLPLGFDPDALSLAFESLERELSLQLKNELWDLENKISHLENPYDYSFKSMGLRQLRRTVWHLLGQVQENVPALAERFERAKSMNEELGLMEALNNLPSAERTRVSEIFEKKWENSTLVINKWLTWHAEFNHADNLHRVQELSRGPHFKAANPNKVRALLTTFANSCWRGFHRADGAGYEFLAEKILEVDGLNPSTAARLSQSLENWYRLEPNRREKMRLVLKKLVENSKLSKNSYEILKRSLDFKALE